VPRQRPTAYLYHCRRPLHLLLAARALPSSPYIPRLSYWPSSIDTVEPLLAPRPVPIAASTSTTVEATRWELGPAHCQPGRFTPSPSSP
jgi:hypothetical protein